MSSPIAKSVKKLASRSSSRHSSAAASSRKRVVAGKSTRLKPATKRSPAGKSASAKAGHKKLREATHRQDRKGLADTARPVQRVQKKDRAQKLSPRRRGLL